MTDETTVTQLELEQLADKLEQVEFTDKERALLVGLITTAGVAAEPEVEGFAIAPPAPDRPSAQVASPGDVSFRSAFVGSLQPGKKFPEPGGTRSIFVTGA